MTELLVRQVNWDNKDQASAFSLTDFNEFLGMMKSKANEADQESDLREAFKIFDKDKNGYIDMKELKQVSYFPIP